MSLSYRLLHRLVGYSCAGQWREFRHALSDPEQSQRTVLAGIAVSHRSLGRAGRISGYQSLSEMPVTSYRDWSQAISKQRHDGEETVTRDVSYYQPTSGSMDNIKWIPYSKRFLHELNRASGAWLADLYRRYPGIADGPHYWSLSWLPDDQRSQMDNDDLEIFPWWKRVLLGRLTVLDRAVSSMPTSRLAQLEGLARLGRRNLSMISVWSPTLLLELVELMFTEKDWLLDEYRSRGYTRAASILAGHDCPSSGFTGAMWPRLALISAWDSSTSGKWARRLKELFPHCEFQGKGLWATEGVVTIPFDGRYPVAVTSHFYEFECLETGEILPVWLLEKGMRLRPILTTGSGLVRYALNDEVTVSGRIRNTPCLEFVGRIGDVDMTGEKTSYERSRSILQRLESEYDATTVSILANDNGSRRYYELLVQGSGMPSGLPAGFERLLMESFHYRNARDQGQLAHSHVTVREDALSYYYQFCRGHIHSDGNIKPEALVLVEGALN